MPKKKITEKKEKTDKEEKKELPKKISQLEFEKKVIELGEKGLTSEKIGEALKKEGIHSKDYSKKISMILKEKKQYVNPDLKNIEIKLNRVTQHYGKNKHDRRSMRDKERIFAHFRKLKSYFKEA